MKTKILILLLALSSLTLSSCEDWLKATSATQVDPDALFSTDEGFHTALTGVYIGMTEKEAYGTYLSWHMLDILAHYYVDIEKSTDFNLHTHQYKTTPATIYLKAIWDGHYNLIANCNNILSNLEKRKSALNPLNYQLVRGEALTLRAYLHFDLMRMFGYGNLRNRNIEGATAIPYVTDFAKAVTPQRTYVETLDLMKKDLLEAAELLYGENGKNCYRITFDQNYFKEANGNDYVYLMSGYNYGYFSTYSIGSCTKVDYYAARAILARVYMWEGTDAGYAEAAKIAEEWIQRESKNWNWVTKSLVTAADVNNRDRTFTQEHVWQLMVSDLNTQVGTWFDASGTNSQTINDHVYLSKPHAFKLFEVESGNNVGASDYRFAYLLVAQGTTSSNYATLKLSQNGGLTNYGKIVPLISTPEMYYICAEVYAEQGEPGKAVGYLNKVRRARGISADLSLSLTYNDVKNEILKEYRKEFVSLGQLFYFYKRLGIADIAGYEAGTMTDSQYVLPYPDDEVTFGNRVQ